jgi:hypothetical protein
MKNALLFLGSVVGTVLLIAGIVALGDGDPSGWWYICAAVLAYGLAMSPGRRIREALKRS